MSTTVPATVRANNSASTLVAQLVDIDAQIDALAERKSRIEEILLERIPVGQAIETPLARIAHVVNSSKTVDIEALEGIAGRTWFNRLTRRSLNTSALNAAIESGNLPGEIAAIVITKVSKPFLRITKH